MRTYIEATDKINELRDLYTKRDILNYDMIIMGKEVLCYDSYVKEFLEKKYKPYFNPIDCSTEEKTKQVWDRVLFRWENDYLGYIGELFAAEEQNPC